MQMLAFAVNQSDPGPPGPLEIKAWAYAEMHLLLLDAPVLRVPQKNQKSEQ